MRLTRRAQLNGIQLDEIDSHIVIRSIDPGVPHENVDSVNRMGGAGSRMTEQHFESLDAAITFAINLPKWETAARREVFDKALAWAAAKGWLSVESMPNRRMWVEKVVYPSAGDIFNWINEYTLTFRAYGVPFWQSTSPVSVRDVSKSSGSYSLGVEGTADTVAEISFKNTSGSTVNTFSVNAGGNEIALADLSMANNETLVIDHTETGLLRIRIQASGGAFRSALDKVTTLTGGGPSADDLYVKPGIRTVSFSAGGAGTFQVNAYGRFM